MEPSALRNYITVVVVYAAAMLALGLLPALGLYFPKFPYEDVYFPYFIVSGPVVWFAGGLVEVGCSRCSLTNGTRVDPGGTDRGSITRLWGEPWH